MNATEFKEYLKNPILFPDEFKTWVTDFYATNIPKIPFSHLLGYSAWKVKEADRVGAAVAASAYSAQETTSSTAWTTLATPGPSLENVPNGIYIVLFGCWSSENCEMGISVDGADPVDEAIVSAQTVWANVGRVFLVDLTSGDGSHSLVAKYRYVAGAPTAYWGDRWLYSMKVSTHA